MRYNPGVAAGQRKLAAMAMGLDARDLPDREAALLAIEATVEMQRAIGVPREIEDMLYQNAAVREVAVVGEADPEWGPAVVAYIALRDPAADLGAILEHVKASLGFKRPKRLYVVGELPNNAAGKRQKSALKPALAIRGSQTVTRT